MPRGDKNGPTGQGPLTGRGLGVCGSENIRFVGNGQGRARGLGRGFNRNFRNVPTSNYTPSLEEEKRDLENRLSEIKNQLDK